MDALKAEIERKRKETDTLKGGPKKYVKRGEAMQIANEARTKQSTSLLESAVSTTASSSSSSHVPSALSSKAAVSSATSDDATAHRIPEADLCARFRSRGVPIRLFAEEYADRVARLKALESTEERSEGQQNDFKQLLAKADSRLAENLLERRDGLENKEDARKREMEGQLEKVDTRAITLKLLDKDPEKTRYLIGVYFKKMLLIWERTLNEWGDAEKRSTQGRLALATRAQTSEYMRPFFSGLIKGTLESDIVARVTEICIHMQDREYLKANDAYLRLSIGNAPWPIGVTMVGIHERSGREKISSSQIAHGLNDETQRKWIQSIKRMMTFAQSIYPPDDLGKAIG